ncbi:MAG: winged helix-turn-helix transcriptional regulator [Thermoplasmata archaeon]
MRFLPIQMSLSGISPATLTTTLRALKRARLIHRVPTRGRNGPVKAYALTDSGLSLYRKLRPLTLWLQSR